jgi:hypothetical protein
VSYRFAKKISYLLKSRHRRGHGIHSPFLFRLITEVIENDGSFSAYPVLKSARENVGDMLRILDMNSFQKEDDSCEKHRSIHFKRLHLLPDRFDRLLLRLVNEFRPQNISFYGSTFGVSVLALALADSRIRVSAQVESSHYRSFCRRLVEVYEIENVDLSGAGKIVATDFVVVQYPLNPVESNRIIGEILAVENFNGVVILCGIHFSKAIQEVWVKQCKSPVVRVSLDLFDIGILICHKGLQKEDFVLRF